jgi:hypothetical protein
MANLRTFERPVDKIMRRMDWESICVIGCRGSHGIVNALIVQDTYTKREGRSGINISDYSQK